MDKSKNIKLLVKDAVDELINDNEKLPEPITIVKIRKILYERQ